MPSSGNANLYVHYGTPVASIAEYDATNHSLKLGIKNFMYSSATANGTMFVDAVAQGTGWVTASLRWYIRGVSGGFAYPGFYGVWIIVKFIIYDLTSSVINEIVLLHEELPWYDPGTWRDVNFDVPLYISHHYRFSINASAHAGITGFGSADMDCGGLSIPDSRIEWGYLTVPNTEPAPKLSIFATFGGTTNPRPGNYWYNFNETVTVRASPNSGYSFNSWSLDGETKYENPITVTMDSDHTLTARFKRKSGGCPTLFVWNGTGYADEGVLNIHAESDITVQHKIQNTLALKNGAYDLQLQELDNFTSHIDQVKLYAVDNLGEWICLR